MNLCMREKEGGGERGGGGEGGRGGESIDFLDAQVQKFKYSIMKQTKI